MSLVSFGSLMVSSCRSQPAGIRVALISRVRRKRYFAKPIAHYPLRCIVEQRRFRRSQHCRPAESICGPVMRHYHESSADPGAPAASGLTACSAAAAGPLSSSTRKEASSRTGTPSVSALSYLLPGLSPAIRNAVFLDTDEVTFPPRACTAAAASSRRDPSGRPVMTPLPPDSGGPPPSAPVASGAGGGGGVQPGVASWTPG